MILVVLRLAANFAALWVAAELLTGVTYDGEWRLLLAAVVLTIVNWAVKPVVTLLAIPLIIVTLGLALLFVNLLMLLLTSWLVDGFRIDGFWAAVGATAIVWAVNALLAAAARDEWSRHRRRDSARRRPPS